MERRKPELLATAGDMERLRAAVDYGADAVYLGGKNFGMRSAPANFSCQELEEGVALCHRRGVKVYVTCNTLPRNQELPEMVPFLKFCQKAGVDGFILSDLGVMALAKKHAPQVERHISTQFGVVNYAAAQACFELGASRVVLAREVPLSEIREIREKVDPRLELEAFAHGSMCVSFSGRCLLSNYLTGRDANRGQCAQPCRWEYTLVEKERPQREFEIFQEERGTYIFNSNDMRMIQHIPAMMEAGISSLKLEGRAKSAYYVACVTQAYRRAIDFFYEHPEEELPASILEETEKISHRTYSTGFYFGDEPGEMPDRGQYTRNYELVAICQGREGDYLRLTQRNRFFARQEVDILQPGREPVLATLDQLKNGDWEPIEKAPHAEMTVYWKTDLEVQPGAYLRVKKAARAV